MDIDLKYGRFCSRHCPGLAMCQVGSVINEGVSILMGPPPQPSHAVQQGGFQACSGRRGKRRVDDDEIAGIGDCPPASMIALGAAAVCPPASMGAAAATAAAAGAVAACPPAPMGAAATAAASATETTAPRQQSKNAPVGKFQRLRHVGCMAMDLLHEDDKDNDKGRTDMVDLCTGGSATTEGQPPLPPPLRPPTTIPGPWGPAQHMGSTNPDMEHCAECQALMQVDSMAACPQQVPCTHLFCRKCSGRHQHGEGDVCPSCMCWVHHSEVPPRKTCPGCGSHLEGDSDDEADTIPGSPLCEADTIPGSPLSARLLPAVWQGRGDHKSDDDGEVGAAPSSPSMHQALTYSIAETMATRNVEDNCARHIVLHGMPPLAQSQAP